MIEDDSKPAVSTEVPEPTPAVTASESAVPVEVPQPQSQPPAPVSTPPAATAPAPPPPPPPPQAEPTQTYAPAPSPAPISNTAPPPSNFPTPAVAEAVAPAPQPSPVADYNAGLAAAATAVVAEPPAPAQAASPIAQGTTAVESSPPIAGEYLDDGVPSAVTVTTTAPPPETEYPVVDPMDFAAASQPQSSPLPPTLEPQQPLQEPNVEAPVSAVSENYGAVAADEAFADLPAIPAVPKTQPIQIKKRTNGLPPAQGLPESATFSDSPALDLPRLDVSLAENATETTLLQESPSAPTTIQLPQVGENVYADSPYDFPIHSPPSEPEAPSPSPSPVAEAAVTESPAPEPVAQTADPVIPELPPMPQETSFAAVVQNAEMTGLESPPAQAEVPYDPEPIQQPEPVPLIQQPELGEPLENTLTSEGSVAQMFQQHLEHSSAGQNESEAGSVMDPTIPQSQRQSSVPSQAEQAVMAAPHLQTAKAERDVLDELLGTDSESAGKETNYTFLILCLVAVAIIAAVGMIAGVYAIGDGFQMPDRAGSEDASDAQKYPLDLSEEGSFDSGETPGADSQSSGQQSTITLPGDESPVMISDSSLNPEPTPDATTPPSTIAPPPENLDTSNSGAQAISQRALDALNSASEDGQAEIMNSLNNGISQISNLDQPVLPPAELSVPSGANLQPTAPANPQFSADTAAIDPPAQVLPSDPPAIPQVMAPVDGNGFPAPGPGDSNLGLSRELVEVFMKAPTWESRLPYIYNAGSLKPAIADYYKKYPHSRAERFSSLLFRIEENPEAGGPYWVYLVAVSDNDQGFPVIVRVEDGMLKVDWEVFAEFQDRHFSNVDSAQMVGPQTFRLVLDRKSDYYGPDREGFTDRDDYICFEASPPYGNPGEFSQYVFVKKSDPLGQMIGRKLPLGDEPLAATMTLEYQPFAHGIRHLVITKWITEGWFQ